MTAIGYTKAGPAAAENALMAFDLARREPIDRLKFRCALPTRYCGNRTYSNSIASNTMPALRAANSSNVSRFA